MKTARKSTSVPKRFIPAPPAPQMNLRKRTRQPPAPPPVKDDTSYDLPRLPDDIILTNILSLLDIRLLARFALLAKPFRDCPKLGQRLDFGQPVFEQLVREGLYVSTVGRIIEEHKGPKIRSLKLRFDPDNNEEHWAMVADWIIKVAQKGIEELDFDFYQGNQAFLLSDDIFKIETLQILRLSYCDFVLPDLETKFAVTGLPCLRILSFKKMSLQDLTVIEALLESCLQLETLELLYCCFPTYFRIAAGHLKRFKECKLVTCMEIMEVTIEAPSLTTLHYFGPMVIFRYKDFDKLTDCILNFKPQRPSLPMEAYKLDKLMYAMSNIEVLTTTSRLLEGLCSRRSDGDSTITNFFCLSKLKEIRLFMEGSGYCNLFTIVSFLRKCPSIEKIYIDCRGWLKMEKMAINSNRPGGYKWVVQQQRLLDRILGPCYPNLKEVKLAGFRFDPHEMQLLYYFVETGLNLETVAIFLPSPHICSGPVGFPDETTLNHYLRPRMASPNARIRVFPHFHDNLLYPPRHARNWNNQF